jgi:hypothetical protein
MLRGRVVHSIEHTVGIVEMKISRDPSQILASSLINMAANITIC